MKKSLVNALLSTQSGGLFQASSTPPSIIKTGAHPGDSLTCIQSCAELIRSEQYTLEAYDPERRVARVKSASQPEVEGRWWDAGLFCLPNMINESGIYLTPIGPEYFTPVEFAGREILSKFTSLLEKMQIPYKELRRERFLELEHTMYEMMFQFEWEGESRFYLASWNGYWLLLQWLRSDTEWAIGENVSNWSLVFIMEKEKSDRRQDVALRFMALWLFHYHEITGENPDWELENLENFAKVLNPPKPGQDYLSPQTFNHLLEILEGKTLEEGSAIVSALIQGSHPPVKESGGAS